MAEKMKGIVIETSGEMYVSECEEPLYKTVGRLLGEWTERRAL